MLLIWDEIFNGLMGVLRLFINALGILVIYSCSSEGQRETMENSEKIVAAPEEKVHPGKMIYMQFCLSCHMANGEGVPGLYPPLIQTEYVLGDKERLIGTVIHGMEGPTEVRGQQYNNIMAKQDYLQDQQIADVLTYIRSNFGNDAEAVTSREVQKVRRTGAK